MTESLTKAFHLICVSIWRLFVNFKIDQLHNMLMRALIQITYKVTKDKSVSFQSHTLALLADHLDLTTCDHFEHVVLD